MTDLLHTAGLLLLSVTLFYHLKMLQLHFRSISDLQAWASGHAETTSEGLEHVAAGFKELYARMDVIEQRLDIEPK